MCKRNNIISYYVCIIYIYTLPLYRGTRAKSAERAIEFVMGFLSSIHPHKTLGGSIYPSPSPTIGRPHCLHRILTATSSISVYIYVCMYVCVYLLSSVFVYVCLYTYYICIHTFCFGLYCKVWPSYLFVFLLNSLAPSAPVLNYIPP